MTDADSVWNTGATNPPNPNCLKCEYAPAAYNIVQRFVANFEYDLPLGRLEALSHVPKRLTNGWKILGIFQAQTGYPFTVSSPYGTFQYGNGGSNRPFFLQKATLNPHRAAPARSSSPSAVIGNRMTAAGTGYFCSANGDQSGTQRGRGDARSGNLGRDTFTAPGWSNLDFSVIKDTHITEIEDAAVPCRVLQHLQYGNVWSADHDRRLARLWCYGLYGHCRTRNSTRVEICLLVCCPG